MVPERRATTQAPESRAVMYSMPVPTYGARARSSGTACRCMFDPISARFASSFSRNGTSEAAAAAGPGRADLVLVGADVHRFDDIADLVLRIPAGVPDDHVVDDAAVLDLAVRRLDEAELVDPRVARQRRDEADVRTFRRLDRADAAVVRRMDVADFEARALARQTAGAERRKTTLMRDFR